jgi:hypothetical protein
MFIGTCAKFVYLATASRDDNAPNIIKVLDSKFFTIYLLRLTNPDLIGIKRRHVHLTLGTIVEAHPQPKSELGVPLRDAPRGPRANEWDYFRGSIFRDQAPLNSCLRGSGLPRPSNGLR